MGYASTIIGEIQPSPGEFDNLIGFLSTAGFHVADDGWLESSLDGRATGFVVSRETKTLKGVGCCGTMDLNSQFVTALRAATEFGLIEFADLIREGQDQGDFEHYLYEHEQWFTEVSITWLVPHGSVDAFEEDIAVQANEILESLP